MDKIWKREKKDIKSFRICEPKITGFTFVTAFRYFPIFFQTRMRALSKVFYLELTCSNLKVLAVRECVLTLSKNQS